MDLFVCSKKLCLKISQRNRLEIHEKNKIQQLFQIKHNKNNVLIVDQSTIAANEPKQMYIALNQTRIIFITHHRYIDYKR